MSTEHSDAQIFSLRRPAELDQLPIFLGHVRQTAETAGLMDAQGARLELAVEEALVNVFNYAYAGQAHAGAVTCRVMVETDGLTVEIVDEGPPFDPLARPDPDTALELEQRQPGGLGIFMIRQLADEVSYRREAGRNVLTIRMRMGIE
jgi:anti-sigma regulatory factor (Ser/Thr protein kinase)